MRRNRELALFEDDFEMRRPDVTLRLQQISATLIREGSNGAIYHHVLDAAIELMFAHMGSMQVFHQERGELRLLAQKGFHPESAAYWEWVRLDSGSTCGMALSAGCRVIVPDIEACEAMVGTADLDAYRRSGIRAVQSTPLIARSGRLLGMISTHWRKPHRPSERELQPLDVLARQAADLIERNEVEAALRESREQFRWLASIVEFSDDAIVSKNLDGIITSWNKSAERLFGYLAEEVIGKPVAILIPLDRQNEEYAILERIRRGDRIDHYETIRRRKDGNLIDVSLTISPVRDAEGNVVGASKIARDITERKQELELLRRQADLLDQSHDAIFTWKIGGGIVYWSKGAERLYEYAAEEAIGRSSHELLRTRSSIPTQEIESQIAREGSWYGELTHTTRDGRTVVVESRHVRVEYSGEIYALETNRDITERKRSEAQISVLARETEHRAKNLLANVRAMVQLSQADTPDGLKEAIAGRIGALASVHSLFAQSRWTGAELGSLVKQELSPYSRDGEMRTQIDGPTVVLKPDLAQAIAVALHELATNAAKYGALSVATGQVRVEWSRLADGKLLLRWTEAGGPPVNPPTRGGFGTNVMQTMIRGCAKGEVRLDWRVEGLVCEISFPI
jgi:PAS domain S-box-containing protein